MKNEAYRVQIRISNDDVLDYKVTWTVTTISANHAKGQACYEAQQANPGMQVRAVDCWSVAAEVEWYK
jgi:hypothetical protein